jgi:hypothetical protein
VEPLGKWVGQVPACKGHPTQGRQVAAWSVHLQGEVWGRKYDESPQVPDRAPEGGPCCFLAVFWALRAAGSPVGPLITTKGLVWM